jgi:hypothetical protein
MDFGMQDFELQDFEMVEFEMEHFEKVGHFVNFDILEEEAEFLVDVVDILVDIENFVEGILEEKVAILVVVVVDILGVEVVDILAVVVVDILEDYFDIVDFVDEIVDCMVVVHVDFEVVVHVDD